MKQINKIIQFLNDIMKRQFRRVDHTAIYNSHESEFTDKDTSPWRNDRKIQSIISSNLRWLTSISK